MPVALEPQARAPVLRGRRLTLRPFTAADITARYLAWLSDAEVNRYSQRLGQPPVTAADARHYLAQLAPNEVVLAIHVEPEGHVGNIKFGPVDHAQRRADISIVIGDKRAWGRGIGAEAVYLVSRYLFDELNLQRLDAGSGNPAFIAMVEGLGWRRETVLPTHVRAGDRLLDWTLLAQRRAEFRRRPELEALP
jgi:ribosomal-protein-alanine N-acetyltransferase